MAIDDILHAVTSLVARATRRLRPHPSSSRLAGPTAKPHLLSRGASFIPFLNNGSSKKKSRNKKKAEEEEEEVIWRKTIIMGEKCDPLDFSGAIYYDSEGNLVADRPPKSPLRSPLPASLMTVGSSGPPRKGK